jgi:hypothetical protein
MKLFLSIYCCLYYGTCLQEVKDAVVAAVTNVTLWYSDPGYLGQMEYWSENHQSMYPKTLYFKKKT